MKNFFLTAFSLFLFVSTVVAQADSLTPFLVSYIPNTNLSVRDVHTDCAGNVIYVGGTSATAFQCTPGTINSSYQGGNSDIFIVKVDSSGQVLWSTLLGGNQYDRAYAVEVDSTGFIYVAGRTGNGLQTTACALQTTFAGDNDPNPAYGVQDGFVSKITPDGKKIVWSTYIGCAGRGFVRDIDLDSKGNIWAAISTASPNFPYISSNAVQPTATHSRNPALIKLSADGKTLLFGTFLADGVIDGGPTTVRVDKKDNAYFLSHASANSIPITPTAFQPTVAGDDDFVISKFDSIGNLIFCSFLGGTGKEEVETHSLEIDAQGNAIVAAYTYGSADFPMVGAPFQNIYNGGREGVIAKIASDGGAILASTFLGGTGLDEIEGIGIDAQDQIYVSGTTASANFPITTATAYQPIKSGNSDGYIAVLSANLSTILYATFVGGSATDQLRTCHVDAWGQVHAGGITASSNYPIFNPFYPTLTGANTGVGVTFRPPVLNQPNLPCAISKAIADPCFATETTNPNGPDILIFPNPASTHFYIESSHFEMFKNLEIIDFYGRLLIDKQSVANNQKIDISQLARGVYFLKVVSPYGTIIKKIMLD